MAVDEIFRQALIAFKKGQDNKHHRIWGVKDVEDAFEAGWKHQEPIITALVAAVKRIKSRFDIADGNVVAIVSKEDVEAARAALASAGVVENL